MGLPGGQAQGELSALPTCSKNPLNSAQCAGGGGGMGCLETEIGKRWEGTRVEMEGTGNRGTPAGPPGLGSTLGSLKFRK